MDTLAQKLDHRFKTWQPAIAEQARQWIAEIMELADQDLLNLVRCRQIEQEVLDLMDELETR